ncbi:hypothetical protein [Clostridium sp.]|uniref:hypothetical protein n=1 Tax=Clostridium sp. TaxID=1506 RepID=UPI00399180E0
MKAKIIGGISLAVALGASVSGAMILHKPKIINSTVYMNNKNNIKKESSTNSIKATKKIKVTLYEFNTTPPANLTKNINKKNPNYVVTTANDNSSYAQSNNFIPLGQGTIKDITTPVNLIPENSYFKHNIFVKKVVEIPVGTKFNILSDPSRYYSKDKIPQGLADTVAIDYNGVKAYIPKAYLNIGPLKNKVELLQSASKEELSKVHYIGTAKVKTFAPAGEGIVFKPSISRQFNISRYSLNLKPGTTVKVIKKGGEVYINEHTIIDGQKINGFGYSTLAIVEYNGIIGSMPYQTLGPIKPLQNK